MGTALGPSGPLPIAVVGSDSPVRRAVRFMHENPEPIWYGVHRTDLVGAVARALGTIEGADGSPVAWGLLSFVAQLVGPACVVPTIHVRRTVAWPKAHQELAHPRFSEIYGGVRDAALQMLPPEERETVDQGIRFAFGGMMSKLVQRELGLPHVQSKSHLLR